MQRGTFSDQIRYWRRARGRTQLEVAMKSGYSQRHVSFLELGRSSPSREAVLVLADTLDLPIGARNALLESAGFAPVYTSEPMTSGKLEYVMSAVEEVLASHRPFPAILVDRVWNMFGANECAMALFGELMEMPGMGAAEEPVNAIRLCLDDNRLKPYIRNWDAFVWGMRAQLKHELERDVTNAPLSDLIDEIEAVVDATESHYSLKQADEFPVRLLELDKEGMRLDLFTMMSAFNFPLDATLAELRIETFLPANQASRELLVGLDRSIAG